VTLVDLTQSYHDGMFSQKLFPAVHVERCIRIEDRGINVTALNVCVHHGTHIDAPRHFFAEGATVADLALEDVCGPAVGLSVDRAAGEAITVADLERQDQAVEPGDIVFIHTGWGRYFSEDPERYQFHPYLGDDAAGWLRERRVKLVALDVPTPDMPEPVRPEGFNWPVHHQLLGAGTLVAEHLNNLDRVAGRRFRAYAFPLPIVGSDGSPVRMVAELSDPNR
jgi:kynurenine formamidase